MPSSESRTETSGLFRAYLELVGDLRSMAIRAVALGTLAGLLEGVALAALVPILHLGQGTGHLEVFGLSERVSALLTTAGFIVVSGVASLSRALSQRGILRVRFEVDRRMRAESLDALIHVDWSVFHTLGEAEVAEAVLAEGERSADGLQSGMQALSGVGAFVALGTFAVFVEPAISLVAIGLGALGVLAYRRLSHDLQAQRHQVRDRSSVAARRALELASAAKYLRSTGDAVYVTDQAKTAFSEVAGISYKVGGHVVLSRFWIEAGAALFLGALLLVSALTETLTPTTLVFFALFYRVVPRALAFNEGVAQAALQRQWLDSWKKRIAELRERRTELPRGLTPTFNATIELRDVHFSHTGSRVPVLKGLSTTIGKGEFVAIVGASGSGKTTSLDLLSGLLQTTSGSVLVDGRPLKELDVVEWQRKIGLMLQDTPLQQGTILESIAGQLPVDADRARRCAEAAEAEGFISALPLGYDTLVGEAGGRFSGGERQRIALARALYRDPLLLLLDEPTSALDPAAEAAILRALVRAKGRYTIVMVAHRLSTIRHADRILFLEEGRVTQSGRWTDLEADLGGPFARMLREQSDPGASMESV